MNIETAKRVTKIFNWFDEFYERPLTDEQREARREKQIAIQKWLDKSTQGEGPYATVMLNYPLPMAREEEDNSL
jgi:hypothetical protein